MNHDVTPKKTSAGNLLRRQSVQEMLDRLEKERQWTEHYIWYLRNVLTGSSDELSEADHQRRRKIESLVPQARLAQWAEIAESPSELENLHSWMQGRLDLAEHLSEQFKELLKDD